MLPTVSFDFHLHQSPSPRLARCIHLSFVLPKILLSRTISLHSTQFSSADVYEVKPFNRKLTLSIAIFLSILPESTSSRISSIISLIPNSFKRNICFFNKQCQILFMSLIFKLFFPIYQVVILTLLYRKTTVKISYELIKTKPNTVWVGINDR